MENETNKNTAANQEAKLSPNANDFLGGNYLRKEDIAEPQNVTIVEVWSERILGSSRAKLIVGFKEFEKPLILNKTNTKRLVTIFGTTETSQWRGQILLYVEKGVEYGGRVVGGLRVKRPRVVNGHAVDSGKDTASANGVNGAF